MATRVSDLRLTGEPRFFFQMAAALCVVVIVGFAMPPMLGRVRYPELPALLYLHGALFLGWCALAVAQPASIGMRRRDLHRTLGWIAVALAVAMTVSGMGVTMAAVAAKRVSPPNIWMAMNVLSMASFVALVVWGVVTRRATDWHRRLLTCATIIMTGPAWARILPVHLFGPFTLLILTIVLLGFVGWGMAHDRRQRGRIHPAWYWGGFIVAVPGLFTLPLALVPGFVAWSDGLVRG